MRSLNCATAWLMSTAFVLLALQDAAAADQPNLLPNGDFSTVSGITGWTKLGGSEVPGLLLFIPPPDADGAVSGSMYVNETTVQSSCFGVVSGASATFGGKAAADLPVPGDVLGEDPLGTMRCNAYAAADCSGPALAVGTLALNAVHVPAYADSTFSGTVPSAAHSANCTVQVQAQTGGFFGFPGMHLDDLFFDSAPPLSMVTLDGYMSGNWYNPAQGGHGFQLEFTDQAQTLLAIWFTYAPSGGVQKWIFAQGPYDLTKTSVTVPALLLDAPAFPPQFDPATVTRSPWGTLTFSFTDCDHGNVSWNSTVPGYGSGSMPIARLTHIAGTSCPR